MRRGASIRGQDGFTLVELMAAALVLVVGMLSVLSVLGTGMKKTTLNRQRTSATNLAREITEAARAATYNQLTPAFIKGELQSVSPSLVSTSGGGVWTVKRTNTTYTVETTVCSFDDPADMVAATPPDNKCANNPAGTTGDLNGDDFRRVTITINWTDQVNRGQTFQQTTLINNPAGGIGPRILSFPAAANVGPGTNDATFSVTTSFAATVHWNADDGVGEGDASRNGSGYTSWSITWPLKNVNATGAVLDGTYLVTAQALDDLGIAGDSKVSTVVVNRSLPFAPTGFKGGHNTRNGDWVELEWTLNSERDITGYRVFDAGADGVVGGSDDRRVCPAIGVTPDKLANSASSCVDASPRPGNVKYYIYALDSSTPSPIGATTMLSVNAPNAQPAQPDNLTVTGTDVPTLTWTAPGSGSVAFYRVYRDGTAVANRIARTGASELTYTDNDGFGTPHSYYVTAVDDKFNESAPLGPAGWSG